MYCLRLPISTNCFLNAIVLLMEDKDLDLNETNHLIGFTQLFFKKITGWQLESLIPGTFLVPLRLWEKPETSANC